MSQSEPFLRCVARNLLAAVFLFAACAKWVQMGDFVGTIAVSGLVPFYFAPIAATIVILLEVLAALAVLSSGFRLQGLYTLLGMLLIFLFYSFWRQIQHIETPCSCFGAIFKIAPPVSILLNFGLLSITVLLLKSYRLQHERVIPSRAGL